MRIDAGTSNGNGAAAARVHAEVERSLDRVEHIDHLAYVERDDPQRPDAPEARGFPWAFALALLLILAVEITLRATGWPTKIPYDLGMDEYHAVAAHLERHGAAEIAIIGSSRARESMHIPTLRRHVDAAAGRKVRIANYGVSGARIYDFEAITRRLLREKRPPKLIILGIAERDFSWDPARFEYAPLFWDVADWKHAYSLRGSEVIEDLPTALRNEFGDAFWTLHYRNQLRLRLRQLVSGEEDLPSPMDGRSSVWQQISPERTLANHPVRRSQLHRFIRQLRPTRYPDYQMKLALQRLCAECNRRGVKLILYEMPIPRILRNSLPAGLYQRFYKDVARVSRATGVQFVRLSSLEYPSRDEDFREPSHMSDLGARRFSRLLAERVIGPTMKRILSEARRQRTTPVSAPAPAAPPAK